MADELTISANSLTFLKNSIGDDFEVAEKLVLINGQRFIRHVQLISTSGELLEIGELGTLGHILIVNRDATHYVTIRMGAGGADVVRINPGESARFRFAGNTPYLVAELSACYVEYFLVED